MGIRWESMRADSSTPQTPAPPDYRTAAPSLWRIAHGDLGVNDHLHHLADMSQLSFPAANGLSFPALSVHQNRTRSLSEYQLWAAIGLGTRYFPAGFALEATGPPRFMGKPSERVLSLTPDGIAQGMSLRRNSLLAWRNHHTQIDELTSHTLAPSSVMTGGIGVVAREIANLMGQERPEPEVVFAA